MLKNIKTKEIILFIIFIIFAGILSVHYGIERTYDTRNYHIYNPYAFLNGRLGLDILPASIQTYYNPLLDIPYYFGIKYLNNHPFFITFLYGFSYALFLFIIYKITKLIFSNYKPFIITLSSVILASGIAIIVRTIGWNSHNIFIGDLILIALYYILKTFDNQYHPKIFLFSGLIAGFAVGAKYTAFVFPVALFISLLLFCRRIKNPAKSLGLFCLGGIGGFLISDGFWLYKLYSTFKNPFYLHFNWIFHTEDIAANDIYSVDFAMSIPNTQKKIWFAPFYTYRIEPLFKLLWFGFVLNILILPFVKREKFEKTFNINLIQNDYILAFAFISFILWIHTFGVLRYYAPILGLACGVFIIFCLKLFYLIKESISHITNKFNLKEHINFNCLEDKYLFLILLILVITFIPKYTLNKERKLIRVPIEKKLLDIENIGIPNNSIVMISAGNAIAIPFQNPNAKYILLNPAEYTRKNSNILTDKKLEEIKKEIKSNKNQIFIITNVNLEKWTFINIKQIRRLNYLEAMLLELDKLGINTKHITCDSIKNNIGNIDFKHNMYFCKLELK